MAGLLVTVKPCDGGQRASSPTFRKGATKVQGVEVNTVINVSTAQYQGLAGYIALIAAGEDTSTVETAITDLSP